MTGDTAPLLEPAAEAAQGLLILGVGEVPAAAVHGDAESSVWVRAQLLELGFTQGISRSMVRRGDAGQARVSGEMRVLLRAKQREIGMPGRIEATRRASVEDLSEHRSEGA